MANESPIVVCVTCGTRNRVAPEKLEQQLAPVCGQCGVPLVGVGRPVTGSDATFERQVLQSPLPVVVDLWAPWCGPCRTIAPTLETIAHENADRLRVVKINVDENPETAGRLGVQGIPTLVVFKNGREIDRIVGALPLSALRRRLEALA